MKSFGLWLCILMISSCSIYDSLFTYQSPVKKMYFEDTMIELNVGETGIVNYTIEPVELLEENELELESSKPECVYIISNTMSNITFKGLSVGVSIITATICGRSCEMVVSVY